VRTSPQQAQSVFNDSDSAITTPRYFLLAFGGIALFVGAFVIAKTLSITVAQRTRAGRSRFGSPPATSRRRPGTRSGPSRSPRARSTPTTPTRRTSSR
jgi:hypothetical protein